MLINEQPSIELSNLEIAKPALLEIPFLESDHLRAGKKSNRTSSKLRMDAAYSYPVQSHPNAPLFRTSDVHGIRAQDLQLASAVTHKSSPAGHEWQGPLWKRKPAGWGWRFGVMSADSANAPPRSLAEAPHPFEATLNLFSSSKTRRGPTAVGVGRSWLRGPCGPPLSFFNVESPRRVGRDLASPSPILGSDTTGK